MDAILIFIERNYGAGFFAVSQGGDPILWQHLFWFFGHPEVYILILPAFGVISEVLPVFSRKPIFGYGAIALSGIAIGFLGFTVWAHHMFTVGLNPIADAIFSADSEIIAIPTSIKIFNWIATLWGGKIKFKTPLLFAVGFISMFIIGGLSGISLAVVPIDFQVHDTYFVVAHLHYVLYGGTVFAIFSAVYYWFPKMTGKLLNETIGKWHFWVTLVGFNVTFLPMHFLGLAGMPRRVYTYGASQGWTFWNYVETIGAFIIALSVLIFIWNLYVSLRKGEKAGNDPWDAQTLEWTISSPPPVHNFSRIPTVYSRRPFWDLKYPQTDSADQSSATLKPIAIEDEGSVIHMPPGSIYPIILAFGLFILFFGLIYSIWLILLGGALAFAGITGWFTQTEKTHPVKKDQ